MFAFITQSWRQFILPDVRLCLPTLWLCGPGGLWYVLMYEIFMAVHHISQYITHHSTSHNTHPPTAGVNATLL